ncbi:MAG: zinc-binding dehydrogenase [Pseudomonadota bacterium]
MQNQQIFIERVGESFRDCTQIKSTQVSEPGANEVLIRHHFAGVNAIYDQMLCADRVDHLEVKPPMAAGVEAIGTVVAAGGDVSKVQVGDAVASIGGGYCLYKCCDQSQVIAVPEASDRILALIPSGVSALLALELTGEMKPGDTVLITAAAGGFGNIATQLAVAAGNHVIAVCGDDRKAAWLGQQGVARVINYRRESLAEVLANEYPDALDLALDSMAGETFDTILEQLAPHGRLVVYGQSSDRLPPAKVFQERVYTRLYWKAASVRGFMNYRFAEHFPAARERLFREVARGALKPLLDTEPFIGLAAVADAADRQLAGQNLGKVFVDLRPREAEVEKTSL